MALLNIQNNLQYIEKELPALQIDDADRISIKHITSPYFVALFDCQEELATLSQRHTVFVIDPLLNKLSDSKTEAGLIITILTTLQKHNALLTQCTDGLIARNAKIEEDHEFTSLVVLMTESVGNILHLTRFVTDTLTTLNTNN